MKKVTCSILAAIPLLVASAAPSHAGASRHGVSALASASDLTGTWHGTLGWVGATFYVDEAVITLEIKDDATFTATVAPIRTANNLAKPAKLSGTVVTRGNRVTLRNTEGPWPWVTLLRSGNPGVLYGVARDPAIAAPVMLKFERDRSGRR